ncbi:ATP-binding protein [uncultured Jatrophihabitans sp.]|uniref:ATP-binding protein n=1 Tax=uncultured Jatrophihabitans sp. TaxID=1610747 RepID=UPI0035CBC059
MAANMTTPARARRLAGAELKLILTSDVHDNVVHDVLVVLSELVTNAVRAGSDTVTVTMDLHRDVLRLAVIDRAEGWPTVQTADATQDHGRGLAIVNMLTAAWGVKYARPGWLGKTVWAEIALQDELTSTLDCHHAG